MPNDTQFSFSVSACQTSVKARVRWSEKSTPNKELTSKENATADSIRRALGSTQPTNSTPLSVDPHLVLVFRELLTPVCESGEHAVHFGCRPVLHLLGLERPPSRPELVNRLRRVRFQREESKL